MHNSHGSSTPMAVKYAKTKAVTLLLQQNDKLLKQVCWACTSLYTRLVIIPGAVTPQTVTDHLVFDSRIETALRVEQDALSRAKQQDRLMAL